MTDNRTTELREKLTECGVEYEADDYKTYAYTYWGDWAYCEPLDAKPGTLGAQCELMLIPATPEQAIAATMGSDEPPYDELLRCLENDWHISASWDGLRKFWCIELTEEGVRMRDAELGSGTCELTETDSYSNANEVIHVLECSECGETRCPHSGRKAVSA